MTKAAGTCRALVILIDFPDKPADRQADTPGFFWSKLFGDQPGTLKGYFLENSYGKFTFGSSARDVVGWIRSPCRHSAIVNGDGIAGTKDDYGLDVSGDALKPAVCEFPLNVWGLVKYAVEAAADSVDLRNYDTNSDGVIDALFVVHAGIGAEIRGSGPGSENYIWSLESSLDYYGPTRGTTIDGVRVGSFVIVPEISEIGVFAHEFCHILGLPDLYNSLDGSSVVGPLCLMDSGAWLGPQGRAGSRPCHLSTPMKYILGWMEPSEVCLGCSGPDSVKDAAMVPVGAETAATVRVLNNPGGMNWTADGRGQGEYFLLENRQPQFGFFEAYLPGSGMLIWKVDESRPDNNTAGKRLATVVQADGGTMDSEAGDNSLPGEPSDFWPGSLDKTEFTPYTSPASTLGEGRFSGAAVERISERLTGEVRADIRVGLAHSGSSYAYPNPYSLSETSPMRIVFRPKPGTPYGFQVTIFDLEGNPVRRLSPSSGVVRSDGTALWDGRDETGRLVDPGLYMYHVRASGEEATGLIGITK
jgi:M6 family metalloprotease-like protein